MPSALFLTTVVKFILVLATTLLGLVAVTFFIGRVVPIDPVLAIVGDRAPATCLRARPAGTRPRPSARRAVRHLREESRDRRFRQFGAHHQSGDDRHRQRLSGDARTRDARHLASAWCSASRSASSPPSNAARLIDQFVRLLGLVGYSVPIFWLGLMGLLLFYAKLGWVEGPGRLDVTYSYMYTPVTGIVLLDTLMQGQMDAFWNALSHILLPACLLGYFSLAYISRMTRSFMLNELAQEYVIAARVKGLSEMRVIWRHALRNAAVPLVTVIALSYANLLEGSVLDRDGLRLAWARPIHHQLAAERRHERGARRNARDRNGLRAAQPRLRPPLPPARSEDPLMAGAPLVSQPDRRPRLAALAGAAFALAGAARPLLSRLARLLPQSARGASASSRRPA